VYSYINYSCPGRFLLETSQLETGISLTFFYSVATASRLLPRVKQPAICLRTRSGCLTQVQNLAACLTYTSDGYLFQVESRLPLPGGRKVFTWPPGSREDGTWPPGSREDGTWPPGSCGPQGRRWSQTAPSFSCSWSAEPKN